MYRTMSEKPVRPKDGDKYKREDGLIVIFNHGRWVRWYDLDIVLS